MKNISTCQECNQTFFPKTDWQTYCTPLCRMRAFHKRNHTDASAATAFSVDDVVPISINSFKDFEWASCCYGWWRANEYLYIGATTLGFTRLSSHHVIARVEPVYLGDEFHIWPMPEAQLFNTERSLILHYKPKYNHIQYSPEEIVFTFPDPIRRSAAPLCPYCHKPYIPFGRGKRRTYCRDCFPPFKPFNWPA